MKRKNTSPSYVFCTSMILTNFLSLSPFLTKLNQSIYISLTFIFVVNSSREAIFFFITLICDKAVLKSFCAKISYLSYKTYRYSFNRLNGLVNTMGASAISVFLYIITIANFFVQHTTDNIKTTPHLSSNIIFWIMILVSFFVPLLNLYFSNTYPETLNIIP